MNRQDQVQVVILAAGLGTRLGRPLPKSQTRLRDGRTIMEQQVDNLRSVLGPDVPITVVVGFKATVIMEAVPDVRFAYNEEFDRTNTSKSLLRALRTSHRGGVLWLNGDVVFDPRVLRHVQPWLDRDETFVCVDTAVVGEEEVKYTVDDEGFVRELSKTVVGGLGEAVGINYVCAADKAVLLEQLAACGDGDYFERGIELAIAERGLHVAPVDISAYDVVEVDFEEDLRRADQIDESHLRLAADVSTAGGVVIGAGSPGALARAVDALIGGYQRRLSPRKGYSCAHRIAHGGDSCSVAVREVVRRRGVLGGVVPGALRFLACYRAVSLLTPQQTSGVCCCGGIPIPFRF